MLLNRNKIQPVLELRAEYPGVCCVCAFFCAWRNMLVVQPVVELCAVAVYHFWGYFYCGGYRVI